MARYTGAHCVRGRLETLFLQNAMADTAAPPVIRRADYAAPAFQIDTVALEFDLVPERTVVKNTMRVRRNPDATRATHLELLGERLEFVSAAIDGAPYAAVRPNEHGLTVENVPETFELTLTSICKPIGHSATTSTLPCHSQRQCVRAQRISNSIMRGASLVAAVFCATILRLGGH